MRHTTSRQTDAYGGRLKAKLIDSFKKMSLKKKILVTGVSKGIGKAIALDLIGKGHEILGTCRNPHTLSDKISGVKYFALDLKDENSIQNCFEAVGEIDVLINNAGESQMGPAEEMSDKEVRDIFETNFFGTISLTKKFIPAMRRKKKGLIINISSLSGRFAVPFQSSYASSKIALNTWTLCIRKELRPFHVSVSLLEPYFIKSGIKTDYIVDERSAYKKMTDRVSESRKATLNKAKEPEVVAKTVAKIIESKSPKGIYISGGMGPFYALLNRFLTSSRAEKMTNKVTGLTGDDLV